MVLADPEQKKIKLPIGFGEGEGKRHGPYKFYNRKHVVFSAYNSHELQNFN